MHYADREPFPEWVTLRTVESHAVARFEAAAASSDADFGHSTAGRAIELVVLGGSLHDSADRAAALEET